MEKQQQWNLWYFVAAFLALLAFQNWLSTATVTERIPYSTFLAHLEADRIATVTVRSEQIEGRYRDPIDGNTHFVTNIVPGDLTERLEQSSAEFDGTVENTLFTMILSWLLPIALILLVWLYVFRRFAERQGMGGMMNVGKSKAQGRSLEFQVNGENSDEVVILIRASDTGEVVRTIPPEELANLSRQVRDGDLNLVSIRA